MSGEQGPARRNLRRFVELSSVRGISRVLKTDSVVVRVIWILAVVTCTSMLIYQLRRVVVQYFSYEFLTVTKEDTSSATVSYNLHFSISGDSTVMKLGEQ